jgi:hypothetical protein
MPYREFNVEMQLYYNEQIPDVIIQTENGINTFIFV